MQSKQYDANLFCDVLLQVENLQIIIEDLQAENKTLLDRVQVLQTNLFQGDNLERARLKQVVTEFTMQVEDLRAQLKER